MSILVETDPVFPEKKITIWNVDVLWMWNVDVLWMWNVDVLWNDDNEDENNGQISVRKAHLSPKPR